MAELLEEFEKSKIDTFRKEFLEILRVFSGIRNVLKNNEMKAFGYVREFKKAISLVNKKYNGVRFESSTNHDLSLRIFIRENDLKEAFMKAAKIEGLASIGAGWFDKANIDETDKFSKEIDKIKNKAFLSYEAKKNGREQFLLKKEKRNGLVEVQTEFSEENGDGAAFKLIAFYALRGKKGKAEVLEVLRSFGFSEKMNYYRGREWLKKFNPKMLE